MPAVKPAIAPPFAAFIFPEVVGPPLFFVAKFTVGFAAMPHTVPLSLIAKVPAVTTPVAVAVYFPVAIAVAVVIVGCVPATAAIPLKTAFFILSVLLEIFAVKA